MSEITKIEGRLWGVFLDTLLRKPWVQLAVVVFTIGLLTMLMAGDDQRMITNPHLWRWGISLAVTAVIWGIIWFIIDTRAFARFVNRALKTIAAGGSIEIC